MALMNRRILLAPVILACLYTANAQVQSGYFGRKNFIGIGTNIFIMNFFGGKNFQVPPVINALKYERALNSLYTAGISLRKGNYKINDEFINDGKPHNYYVRYNGADRIINNGKGRYDIHCMDVLLLVKRFAKYRGYLPYGKFKALKFGVSRQVVEINEGYEFSYSEYYSNLRKTYRLSGKKNLPYTKFVAGVEIGRTVRFFSDQWLFSYSVNAMTSFRRKFDREANLNERFQYESEKFVMNYQLFSFNFDLSYAF
jgi:hypothetical protein